MKPALADRLSRAVVGCYPRRWKQRYAAEMLDVLDQHRAGPRTVLSLAGGALGTHLDPDYRMQIRLKPHLSRDAKLYIAIFAAIIVGAPASIRFKRDLTNDGAFTAAGEDVTYERKIREIIVASRVESTLTKAEILELYLNSAYLGRSSWGVEMAARSYFGKSAKALTLGEGAMLAGLLKGPNFFNPDRRPERAKKRLAYVLGRMQEDGVISPEQRAEALAAPPKVRLCEPI